MKEKIKQIVINGTTVYIFTDEPEKDIKVFEEAYTNDDDDSNMGFQLGYEAPLLTDYTFLGKKYKCISLWFDNEDVPDFFKDFS